MIIATRDNEIEYQFLVIADVTHNHPPSLPGTHLIHWQFVCIDKEKELIISQTGIGTSSKQVIAAIQSGTDKNNTLIKPKDIYNNHATQR